VIGVFVYVVMGLKRGPDTESSLKFHGCMNSPHFSLPTQLQLTFSAFSRALPVWMLTYLLFAFLATGCLGQANQRTFAVDRQVVCAPVHFPEDLPCPPGKIPPCYGPGGKTPRGGKLPQISVCSPADEMNCGGMFCNGTCHVYGPYFSCVYETDEQCQSLGACGLCTEEGGCEDRSAICLNGCCFIESY